uniref:Biliverdin reductase A-like n=1 Tax=Crassostrea virginica TaxID=6565 RepID=A0A8B8AT95_CRAVI|nr:biliverdin reductase A-like [Crassostrea virginica]XP_022294405.1 biliverdin reductase A-like [Crassostrea virginica]
MSSKVYGVVVFGLGIAGRVRVRDLLQYTSHGDLQWCLKGFVSRRNLEIDGATQLEEDEVFTRDDIDAILVCTENGSHERLVRKGLENGKHVLCEFPLALSLNVAKEFFDMAERKGLILHEENIGLINNYKEQLDQSPERWIQCNITLKGNYNGWVEDHKTSGPPFICNVSLIETACHLCGDVKVVGGAYTEDEASFQAKANLETPDKRTVTITLKRSKDSGGREKSIIFKLEDGKELNLRSSKTPGAKPGLFMRDFHKFIEEISSGQIDQEMRTRTLRAFQIAEEIHQIIMPKAIKV